MNCQMNLKKFWQVKSIIHHQHHLGCHHHQNRWRMHSVMHKKLMQQRLLCIDDDAFNGGNDFWYSMKLLQKKKKTCLFWLLSVAMRSIYNTHHVRCVEKNYIILICWCWRKIYCPLRDGFFFKFFVWRMKTSSIDWWLQSCVRLL